MSQYEMTGPGCFLTRVSNACTYACCLHERIWYVIEMTSKYIYIIGWEPVKPEVG